MEANKNAHWVGPKWRGYPSSFSHPLHLKNLAGGSRLIVFGALWRNACGEHSCRWGGLVHEGEPFKVVTLAKQIKVSPRRCREIMAELRALGYVLTAPSGHAGVKALVRMWPASGGPEKCEANVFWDFKDNRPAVNSDDSAEDCFEAPIAAAGKASLPCGDSADIGCEDSAVGGGNGALGVGKYRTARPPLSPPSIP